VTLALRWVSIPATVVLIVTMMAGCGAGATETPPKPPSQPTAPASQVDPEKSGWLVTDASQSHIEDAARKGLPAVVKLGSDSCGPCREMNPVMAELSRQYSGRIVFLIVDVYKNQGLASKYGVRVIPTIVYINASGKAVAYSEGYAPVDQMKSFIDRSGILREAAP